MLELMLACALNNVGNLPALFNPGPNKRGINFITISGAKKFAYESANFLTSFLFLLSFFRSSIVLYAIPTFTALSQVVVSPKIQTLIRGRGVNGSFTEPEKRLSFCGS